MANKLIHVLQANAADVNAIGFFGCSELEPMALAALVFFIFSYTK